MAQSRLESCTAQSRPVQHNRDMYSTIESRTIQSRALQHIQEARTAQHSWSLYYTVECCTAQWRLENWECTAQSTAVQLLQHSQEPYSTVETRDLYTTVECRTAQSKARDYYELMWNIIYVNVQFISLLIKVKKDLNFHIYVNWIIRYYQVFKLFRYYLIICFPILNGYFSRILLPMVPEYLIF